MWNKLLRLLPVMTVLITGCGESSGVRSTLLGANNSIGQYYAGAEGKRGEDLKQALNNIIKGHVQLTYSEVWEALKMADEDPQNHDNVIGFYSKQSLPKSATVAGEGGGNGWNREHVWAKSHGFPKPNMPAYTDIHHLRACEADINSLRGDAVFADLKKQGQPVKNAAGNYVDTAREIWEPRDDIKGDIARIFFYMDTRYQGKTAQEPDLIIVEDLPAGTKNGVDADGNGYFGKYSDLIKWNKMDPVDDAERARNEKVFEIQNNRNPFIDHPEYADAIYGQ